MAKNKLARFAENETFSNLFQHSDYQNSETPFPLKGKWGERYFKNDHPIVLELGCGKGEYTIALSERFPEKNFIGIDRKGARLWRGAKTAIEEQKSNVAFLRIGIDNIASYFAENEIAEIWITFPDPQPKKIRRRLTSPIFIKRYEAILKQDGSINLKTDSRMLYEYTLQTAKEINWQILEDVEDVYHSDCSPLLTEIQTFYEKMWLAEGKIISYIKFTR